MAETAPVVVGLGAVSPAGLGTEALWRAVTTGAVATGPMTRYDVSAYPTDRAGEVPAHALADLDGLVPGHASLAARYLAAAALEALRDAGLDPRRPGCRVGAYVGTVMGVRPVLDRGVGAGRLTTGEPLWAQPERLLDVLHEVVAVDGPSVLAAPGCSAGNTAVALGCAALAAGEVDVAVCGGVDELSLEVFSMFTSLRGLAPDVIRPFDVDRRGTLPSEGAGVLVLERPAGAAARGARPVAAVLGHASRADAHHMTQPRPDGAAVVGTITACLRRAGLRPDDVGWVCAHGTGTPANDGIEAEALATALRGGSRPPAVSSIKGTVGHAVGAAAALEAVVAALALDRQVIPGNPTLLRPDPACSGVDLVAPGGRAGPVDAVLSPAFGFGGAVTTILLGGARPGGRRG
jgi:3-oxoacyl-[acyl-carrier-protein] synthase II